MFVISAPTVPGQGLQAYHNMLANDAFTNWQTIMTDVTLSPGMSIYLDMLNSAKPANGLIANENFARENMQLFNIGLDLMNQEYGLQHLDIKPRNLFLVHQHVKVADFGLVNSLADLNGQGQSKCQDTRGNNPKCLRHQDSAR